MKNIIFFVIQRYKYGEAVVLCVVYVIAHYYILSRNIHYNSIVINLDFA